MAAPATAAEVKAFIAKVAPSAIQDWKNTHVMLPSITIAQAGLESGWGKSDLAIMANNFFGIKVSNGWTGDSVWYNSPEVVNGQKIMKLSNFRKYPTMLEGLSDHNNFFVRNKKRYGNIIGNTNFEQVRVLIQQDGYATDPDYPAKLLKIYNSHNLGQYDIMAGAVPGQAGQQVVAPAITQTTMQPTTQSNPTIIYAVQTGAFRNPNNAQSMLSKVKASEFDAYVVKMNDLYKIQIGAFGVRANAEKRLTEVKKKGFDAVIVTKKR